MLKGWRFPSCNSRMGSILVMTALSAVFTLGMVALVTDVGFMYYSQSKLQTAVNAGWKAGYDRILELRQSSGMPLTTQEKQQVISHIREVMSVNGFKEQSLKTLNIEFDNDPFKNGLEINSTANVGLFFAQIMNIKNANVSALRENSADVGGIIPLAIPHGVVRDVSKNVYTWDPFTGESGFKEEEEYILKLGDGDVVSSGDIMPFGVEVNNPDDSQFFGFTPGIEYSIKSSPGDDTTGLPYRGNFGGLGLGGPGANIFYDNIINGYDGVLNVGQWVDSETGNMAKLVEHVNNRIDDGLVNVRVPVVTDFGNGKKPVQILGFLNFTLVGTGLEGQGNSAKATVRAVFNGFDDHDLGNKKHNYGIIDPDNVRGGDESDYLNRLTYGYNGAIQINDRIIPEPENKPIPTDDAVEYRLELAKTHQSAKRVIVPITDVGPEIATNNLNNATATAIYDLQGLENPNGVYNTSEFSFGSAVRIIGYAEFELIDPMESGQGYDRLGDSYESGDNGDLGPYQAGQVRGKFIRYIIKPGEIPAV